MNILPTNHCFDDALDFVELLIVANPDLKEDITANIHIVHGICLMPDNEPYAHAWVEDDKDGVCIFRGIVEGEIEIEPTYLKAAKAEYYEHFRVQETTRYTLAQACKENCESSVYFTVNDEPIDSFDTALQVRKMSLLEADIDMHSFFLKRQIEATERFTNFLNSISEIALAPLPEIPEETAAKISFPADPVTTKQHCYFFEHRGGKKTFTNQIRAMGLSAVQVLPVSVSPLWDSQHPNEKFKLDRQEEFNNLWGMAPGDKVVFICPVYNMYPQIISSLICQTHKNWELLLIHNGPLNGMKYDIPEDPRIKFIIYPEQTGKWGHVLRAWALREKELSDYTVVTNADNYYVPTFIEYMLKGFKNSHSAVATYCQQMTHSYKAWEVINCKTERGYIDCGGVMVRSDIAKEIGWKDTDSHSSDFTYFSDIAARYSWKNFVQVKGNLFVHN